METVQVIHSPTLNPPLKWFGGKHYLARRIIEIMPLHSRYIEPYAGGLAVLLAKNPEGVAEIVNDKNGWLTNFWNVLRSPTQFHDFQRMAEATPFSETEWNEVAAKRTAQPDLTAYDPVTAAWMFFVHCRQRRAGRMEKIATISRNRNRRGMCEQVSAWLTAVDGLPTVHERLRRVLILNRPALDVIQELDGPDALYYLDPTYLHETRTDIKAYGAFEMTHEDHVELLGAIRQCKGKVIISGYDCGLYNKALVDWNRHTWDLPNNAAGGKTKDRETEVVWCNF